MRAVDQLLHACWGAAPVAVILLLLPVSPVLAGAVGAVLVALPREIVDQWPIARAWDTALDLAFFAAGGAGAGLVWILV